MPGVSESPDYRPAQGEAWCTVHWCHPNKCWDMHNPMHAVYVNQRRESEEARRQQIAKLHAERQQLLTWCPDCEKYVQMPHLKCNKKEEHAES